MRSALRTAVTGFAIGALGIGSAWAGSVLVGPQLDPVDDVADLVGEPVVEAEAAAVDELSSSGTPDVSQVVGGQQLPGGWFRAGSASRTLVPPDDLWTKKGSECGQPSQPMLYTAMTPEGCLITFDGYWAEGIDERNPILVRTAVISNGRDAVVFGVLDLVGYMASYPNLPDGPCPSGDCGIAQIAATMSGELGIPAQNFVIASSHTHAAPSTIADGPSWYYEFVRDQIQDSIRAAVADAAANPAVRVESGAVPAKPFNVDRRTINRAVPDFELAWLRAFVPAESGEEPAPSEEPTQDPSGNNGKGKGQGKKDPPTEPTPSEPEPSEPAGERTVVTLGNFAVHPTVRAGNRELHSGFLGPFDQRLRNELGSSGLFFPGGLGDQTVDRSYGVYGMGAGLADLIVDDLGNGHVLGSNDIAVHRTEVRIPVENHFFAGALATGYAVRDIQPPFGGGPYAVAVRTGGNKPVCEGAAELHVVGPVSAIRLGAQPPGGKVAGDPAGFPTPTPVPSPGEFRLPVETDNVVLVQAPGEIFASISGIVKDYLSRSNNVLVMGMTNDTLGYMIPVNQFDLTASQGAGLVHNATDTGNYEEALSLGRCTGEIVMNAMLEAGAALGVMGEGEGPGNADVGTP